LVADGDLPTCASASRLLLSLEAVCQQSRHVASEFPLFAFAQVFDLLGQMRSIRLVEPSLT